MLSRGSELVLLSAANDEAENMTQRKSAKYAGVLSLLCSAIFWIPIVFAELGVSPSFRIPPFIVEISWLGAFSLAIIAGCRGSRWWVSAALWPALAVWASIQMIQC